MIVSEDGYCPSCKEGDVNNTGHLENFQFFKCNQCGEHYRFNINKIELDQLPFTKPIVV